ncbi:MAG: hypothetical protein JJU02_11075 [Cryomorphaceae bacterium]|nr:hypothetical protein [Cryomorphaceae bacterium]
MKKIIVPIFALVSFAFISCSSDDDSGSANDATKILGTWNLDHYESLDRDEETINGEVHVSVFKSHTTSSGIVWEFKENPNEIEYSGLAEVASVTYEIVDGDTIDSNSYSNTLPLFEGDLVWSLDTDNGTISLAPDGSMGANYTLTDTELRIWRDVTSGGTQSQVEFIFTR